jgi:hypothetical protein
MKTRYRIRTMVCMVLALLLVLDFSVFQPVPALGASKSGIDTKSALIGGAVGVAAGAGIVLAAPAIGGAIAGAGGIAGVGTAIVGGAASVLGGVIGVFGAIGGAIASAFAAVGGFIAGIVASPLFIPALILVGAAVVGYFAYKKYKESKGKDGKTSKSPVFSADDNIYISPADYEMSSVIPGGDAPITVSKEIISIGGTSGDVSVSVSSDAPVVAETPQEKVEASGEISTANSASLKAAHDRYISCYQKYTTLVTNSGGADANTVNKALQDYRDAYNEYQTLKAVNGNK